MEDFDRNINDTVELKQGDDTLAFKRNYAKLNVFERMSVDLTLNYGETPPDYSSILKSKGYKQSENGGVWSRGQDSETIDANESSAVLIKNKGNVIRCSDEDGLLKEIHILDCAKLGLDINRISASLLEKHSDLKGVVDDRCLVISVSKLLRDSGINIGATDVNAIVGSLDRANRTKNINNETSSGLSFDAMDNLTRSISETIVDRAYENNVFSTQELNSEPPPEPLRRNSSHLKLV